MIKQNLHTHSVYCDGKDTIEEMVETAIKKGFTTIGFSGHGYNHPLDTGSMNDDEQASYIKDVLNAKEKYQDKIKIYLGVEQDSIGRVFDHDPFEYIIGSVHFLPYHDTYLPIDNDVATLRKLVECYDGDFLKLAKAYFEAEKTLSSHPEVDIMGHIDLVTKYNEDESFIKFDDPTYVGYACDCIDEIIKNDKIIEVNTGAIARGYRKTPYPYRNLLTYIYQKNGKICLNSDCHNRNKLDCDFDQALEMIKQAGFKEMMVFNGKKFEARSIDEFKC